MANVAALDCGSLSTRLLVADAEGVTLERMMRVTGLGRGVDRAGRLSPEAVDRVLEVLGGYRAVMDAHGVEAVAMVGTSALRDAADRDSFRERAAAVVGAELELLDGGTEALLSFRGATAELAAEQGPFLVVDIGGGSTELATGPVPFVARSLDVGCVRLTERHLGSGPPSAAELARARSWVRDLLAGLEGQLPVPGGAATLVGLAGTVSALACYAQGLTRYDRRLVHHYRLARTAVVDALGRLAALPAAERAGLPGVEAARAPFIVGGALVLDEVMAWAGFEECLVSEADILDGLVMRLLERGAGS